MLLMLLSALGFYTPTSASLDQVVRIEYYDADDKSWSTIGTGMYVQDQRIPGEYGVLSAKHVVSASSHRPIRACFIQFGDCIPLEQMLYSTNNRDWTIFMVHPQVFRRPAHFAQKQRVLLGQEVWTVGYPNGEFRYARGYVAGPPLANELLLDLNIMHGSSGEAVMNSRGQILCIATAFDQTPMSEEIPLPIGVFSRTHCERIF